MKKILMIMTAITLSACAADEPGKPRGQANILHQTGYLMQCASKACPTMYNEPTPEQYEKDRASIKPVTTAPAPPPSGNGKGYNF